MDEIIIHLDKDENDIVSVSLFVDGEEDTDEDLVEFNKAANGYFELSITKNGDRWGATYQATAT